MSARVASKKDAFRLAQSSAVGYGVALLAAPLLTRLYSVSDFGRLQNYVAVCGLGIAIVTARYEWAVFLPEQSVDAACIVVLGLLIGVVTSVAYTVGIWIGVAEHFLPSSVVSIKPYIWILPISMFGAGTYGILNQWLVREKEYKDVAATKVTQAVGSVAIQVTAGFATHLGPLGLILGDVFGKAGGIGRMVRVLLKKCLPSILAFRWRRMLDMGYRYRAFPLVSTGSAMINALGLGVPVLMIGAFYGDAVLGWFSLVERFLNVPVVIIGQAISQIYVSEMAVHARGNPKALRLCLSKYLWELAAFAFLPFLLLWFVAPWAGSFLFGAKWMEAGYYARILIPMDYVSFIVWPFIPTLNLLERQGVQLAWDLVRLGVAVGGLYVAHNLGFGARGALVAYSATMFATYSVHIVLSFRAIEGHRATLVQPPQAAP